MSTPECKQFQLHWTDCAQRIQKRNFWTLRQMRGYEKTQCAGFSHLLKRSMWNGQKYERFMIIGGTIVLLSSLRSYVEFLSAD